MSTKEKTQNTQSRVEVPSKWTPKYSDDDKAKVIQIIEWLNAGQHHEPGYANQRSQTKLAKWAKVKQTTLNTVLSGKYPSPPTHWLNNILEALLREGERDDSVLSSFVETTVYRTVQAACHRAHIYRNFGVVAAAVGTGKTTAVKHYVVKNSNVYLIEATPDMNASVLVNDLVAQTKAVVHKADKYSRGTKAEKTAAIIRALKDTDSLLILDEAETVTPATLEYIRRISDKANIGVVLTGTERLLPMIRDKEGRFGQISSRVGFWPPVIRSINEQDAIELTYSLIGDGVELTDELLDAFWQMCDGSARVLANALIPGVRDYIIKKKIKLTPESIYQVGEKVLGFKRTRKMTEVA